jgi:hypothetical protein
MIENTILPAAQWAQNEFGFAQLGDKRRNKRLVNIATHLAEKPGGTLPGTFEGWAELKAAYRFFGQRGVGFQSVIRPHIDRTRAACQESGEYLIIEDTTLLDYYSQGATENLGRIGDGGRGFELHSALAVRVNSWTLEQRPEGTLIGLFGQTCNAPRPAPRGESRRQRLSRPRKSQRWAEAFKEAGRQPEQSQWIYIADRESDFYEPMRLCQQHGVDFVIRGFQDRRLAAEAGRLRDALAQATVLGQSVVQIRSRPGQSERTATVELRAVRVDLDGPWRPGGWQDPLPGVTALEVREIQCPEGVKEPLYWLLLTSLPATTLAQAQRIVGRYTARWWIEEYHKAIKTGAGVEESQLQRADRLEPLIAILAVVAVRLLSAKMLARSRPEGEEALTSFGPDILALLDKKFGTPKQGWNNQTIIIAIARLGGFLARKHDGMPGWQTIWRGWQRLIWMCEGVKILSSS